ncbi:PH domain-containing protein [Halostagnicola sp. A-GB9-2]|uniref:PH domain-containing protein n=1 Tax=Halostagnicola sp. A-GB9-2 TaxID=3048066 RepID=UPI0024C029F9|nr:PH domain-containing protein [Halostagnicola sp. A-GB9-2]MDJ1434497.1 PH domain-containing protein [Halostagnicola sp. A-GB9-2]
MSATEYDWLSLEPDEEVVWSGQPELLGYVWVFVTGIVLIPLFGVGLVIIASTYFHAQNTAYVITTDSVFKKTGIFSRKITDIGHENIQDTGYNQGIVGRRYGFGTVQISTAGGSGVEMSLSYVQDPLAVQSRLDRAVTKRPQTDDSAESDGLGSVRIDAAVLEELTEEMRATRKALESIEERLDEQ